MKEQHLVIIIDNNDCIAPKKYSCPFNEKTKEEAISSAKKQYEDTTGNFDYKSYYFKHEIK